MAPEPSKAQALAQGRAQSFFDAVTGEEARQVHGESFDFVALSGITNVKSNGPGHCVADLPVTQKVCNWMGNLHGGCTGVRHAHLASRKLEVCCIYGMA